MLHKPIKNLMTLKERNYLRAFTTSVRRNKWVGASPRSYMSWCYNFCAIAYRLPLRGKNAKYIHRFRASSSVG